MAGKGQRTEDKKIDAPQIRKANRQAVFEYIKRNPETTKNTLSMELGLSRPTVAGIVEELEQAGMIKAIRSSVNTGGRSAMGYVIISEAYRAVGIQLSDHHIRGVIVDLNGDITGKICVKQNFDSGEEYRKILGQTYQKLLEENGLKEEDISATGVAVQALIDQDGKRIIYMPNENAGLSRYDQLLKYIPGETRFFHDLMALGYNEKLKVDSNVFYLSVNNRIGGMLLIGENVYHGSNNKAGEVGHMQLVHNGRKCYCGNRGCFDAYCNTDVLRKSIDGRLEEFFAEVSRENQTARKQLHEYLEYLAEAIFSIRMLFDGVVIIGGELGQYAEYFLGELRDLLDQKAFFPDEHATEYLMADQLGEYAIAIGAAMYYCDHVLDSF